ncbi:hypothetical protein [Stackebrandtia nassauensis]|uniref:Uncharacterized protein n=1 Tax=Stackebrandtia nassauensis (strain DSM 44728 / CIP 108903 / NRRL B-16338 / NBRC 102104 / LLR-40K-21) TaxID=446470 RepID=D3Q277_STANL|nr:hypothetical protein [Stackebrandtia nassauensis]ADD43810.1 hypothetical protein Snas_4159 [Stackebrandtia nassauensis DSM 44728]
MTVSAADLANKGMEVRNKAVEKWMEEEAGIYASTELQTAVEGAFDYIVTMFEQMGLRDPKRLDTMSGYLADARTTLTEPVIGEIDTIKGQLDDWEGDAADNFIFDYLSPLTQINANQIYYIGVLENTLDGVKTMLEESRKNTIQLGDKTIEALDALEDTGEGMYALTIVAAVVGVVGAVVTGGASVALAVSFASISGAISIGAGAVTLEEQRVSGDDVEAVLNSMIDSYWDINDTNRIIEEDLAKLLGQDVDTVREQANRYRPIIPDISGYGSSPKDREILGEFQPPA